MKLFVIIMFVAIVASLGSSLFYLTRDTQGSARMLKALKIRVALSITLVVFSLPPISWAGSTRQRSPVRAEGPLPVQFTPPPLLVTGDGVAGQQRLLYIQ